MQQSTAEQQQLTLGLLACTTQVLGPQRVNTAHGWMNGWCVCVRVCAHVRARVFVRMCGWAVYACVLHVSLLVREAFLQ